MAESDDDDAHGWCRGERRLVTQKVNSTKLNTPIAPSAKRRPAKSNFIRLKSNPAYSTHKTADHNTFASFQYVTPSGRGRCPPAAKPIVNKMKPIRTTRVATMSRRWIGGSTESTARSLLNFRLCCCV